MNITLTNLQYEVEDEIGYLYLNGASGNKMTTLFLEEICYVFEQVIFKDAIKGLIILGKGRHFSSGADVGQLIQNVVDKSIISEGEVVGIPSFVVQIKEVFHSVAELNIPVVTGVSGFCIGSGLELALTGSIRICAEGSKIGFPESGFGLLPGASGTYRSMELIGMSNSMEMVLSGEFMDAKKAVTLGLFHKICGKKEVRTSCEQELFKVLDRNCNQ